MANYMGMMRTNYFKVNDVDAFNKLTDGLSAEDNITVEVTDGNTCFIGCYAPLEYEDEDGDYNMDSFYGQLSKLIVDGDAAIFMEVGNEKLRYLVGSAIIVTSKGFDWIDLSLMAVNKAKEMLGNNEWETKMEY